MVRSNERPTFAPSFDTKGKEPALALQLLPYLMQLLLRSAWKRSASTVAPELCKEIATVLTNASGAAGAPPRAGRARGCCVLAERQSEASRR